MTDNILPTGVMSTVCTVLRIFDIRFAEVRSKSGDATWEWQKGVGGLQEVRGVTMCGVCRRISVLSGDQELDAKEVKGGLVADVRYSRI